MNKRPGSLHVRSSSINPPLACGGTHSGRVSSSSGNRRRPSPIRLCSKKKKKKELFCRDQASLPGCPCFPFSYFNVWGEWQATDGGGQIDVIALDDPLPFPTPFWKLHPRKAIAGDSAAVDSAARGPGPLPGLVNAGPARTGGKRLPAPSLPRRPAHRGPSGSCTPSRSRWKPGCRGAPRCQDSPSKHLSGLAEWEGCPAERGQRKALGGQQNWNESSHSAVGRKQPHRAQLWILLEGNRVKDYGPGQAQPSPAQPSQGRAQRQPELWQQRRQRRQQQRGRLSSVTGILGWIIRITLLLLKNTRSRGEYQRQAGSGRPSRPTSGPPNASGCQAESKEPSSSPSSAPRRCRGLAGVAGAEPLGMELERGPALAGTACARPGGSSSQPWRAANPRSGYSPFLFPVEVAPKEGGERAGDEKAPPGSRRLGQHLLGHHIAFLPCLMAAGCARAGKTIPQKSKLQGKMRSPVLSFEALPDQLGAELSPKHGFPLENGAFLGGVPGPHWVLVPKGSSRPGNTESLCTQGSRHLAQPSRSDSVLSSVAWVPSEESNPPWPYGHPPHHVGSHRDSGHLHRQLVRSVCREGAGPLLDTPKASPFQNQFK